jgi:tRNA threonylcarbamoyladenosine modification (KEOPS) complex Cgi121 subunit
MGIYNLGGPAGLRYLLIIGIRPGRSYSIQEVLKSISSDPETSVQIFGAESVAGYEHLLAAALLTVRAWTAKRNLANSPAIEVLLYASAKRQIKEAIGSSGVKEGSRGWVVIALSSSRARLRAVREAIMHYGSEDEGLVELTENKFPFLVDKYGITQDEMAVARQLCTSKLEALKSLVLERVALSDLYR